MPPDLIVEVLSPNDRAKAVMEKVRDYFSVGIAAVWLIDPERRRLTIHRRDNPSPTVLGEDDDVDGQPELPGFRCRVAEFLA